MSTDVIERPQPKEGVLFTVTESTIADQVAKYSTLQSIPEGDEKAFEVIKAARVDCKNARCKIENEREKAKRPVLDLGKLIDSTALKLTNMIEPTEKRLLALENAFETAQKKLEEERIEVRYQVRTDRLKAVGGPHIPQDYRHWSNEAFTTFLTEAKEHNDRRREEDERQVKIAADNKAEQERLAKLQKELDDKRADDAEELAEQQRQLQAQQDVIDAQQKAFDDAQKAKTEAIAAEPIASKEEIETDEKDIPSAYQPGGKNCAPRSSIQSDESITTRQQNQAEDRLKANDFANLIDEMKLPDFSEDSPFLKSEVTNAKERFVLAIRNFTRKCPDCFLLKPTGEIMLVLSRNRGETIEIGKAGDVLEGPIIVIATDFNIRRGNVRIGIEAPKHISIHRGEVADEIRDEGSAH